MSPARSALTAAMILVVSSGAAHGSYWWDMKTVTVSPPRGATPMDDVSLTLSGEWGDSCVPDRIAHVRTGDTIFVDVEYAGINVACLTVISSWSLSANLGNLPPGEYSMVGTLYRYDPFNDRTPRERDEGPDVLVSGYRVAPARPGDMNGDERVNRMDLAMLVGHYGMAGGATPHEGDLDGDGAVSLADVALLRRDFDADPAATASVPEPSAMGLAGLLLGGLAIFARRRSH